MIAGDTIQFQFPSNGKVFLNKAAVEAQAAVAMFQFPSNGKDFLNVLKMLI